MGCAAQLDPAVDALITALDDPNWRVAEYAGISLGRLGDPRATAPLVARLDHASKWIRRRTVNALAEPAALEPVAERLNDPSREVRREVIRALIGYCNRAIRPVNDLAKQYRELGQEAAETEGLGDIKHKLDAARAEFLTVYQAAAAAMKDEYHIIRQRWIEVVPRYSQGVDVLAVVLESLQDPHDGVRESALKALGQLHGQAHEANRLDQLRRRAAAVPTLTKLLGDYYTLVREQAVNVFADVVGRSIEEATGRAPDEWRRQFPRPGDPRSPHGKQRRPGSED